MDKQMATLVDAAGRPISLGRFEAAYSAPRILASSDRFDTILAAIANASTEAAAEAEAHWLGPRRGKIGARVPIDGTPPPDWLLGRR